MSENSFDYLAAQAREKLGVELQSPWNKVALGFFGTLDSLMKSKPGQGVKEIPQDAWVHITPLAEAFATVAALDNHAQDENPDMEAIHQEIDIGAQQLLAGLRTDKGQILAQDAAEGLYKMQAQSQANKERLIDLGQDGAILASTYTLYQNTTFFIGSIAMGFEMAMLATMGLMAWKGKEIMEEYKRGTRYHAQRQFERPFDKLVAIGQEAMEKEAEQALKRAQGQENNNSLGRNGPSPAEPS